MDGSTSGLPVHHQLLEFTQTHVHWVSDAINHLILCHPLLLPPSIFPSLRVFSSESVYQRTNTSSPPAIEQTGWLLCCSVFSLFFILYWSIVDLLPSWPSGKEFTCSAWDLGSIPGLTRSPEEEMATLSSILAWKIQWREEPGGL